MAKGRRWTEDETRQTLQLYHRAPFGQFTQNNREVIALARSIDRSPSSVAMKLCNFASLDPKITRSGRKGLQNASALDRQVWAASQKG
jgi:hypothetical protein